MIRLITAVLTIAIIGAILLGHHMTALGYEDGDKVGMLDGGVFLIVSLMIAFALGAP